MARTVDELTFDYEDQGQLVRKELKKVVLSKGAWATVMFLYQDLDRKTGMYREPKVSIVRFKKSNGVYRKQSGFNISSEKQARQIIETIEGWYAEPPPPPSPAEPAKGPAADAAPAEAASAPDEEQSAEAPPAEPAAEASAPTESEPA